jgi:hypothetical protein
MSESKKARIAETVGEAFAYLRWRIMRAARVDDYPCTCQGCTQIFFARWRAGHRDF